MFRILGPPVQESTRLPVGLVASLLLHVAAALPLVLPERIEDARQDPIEQMVVFLVPPDKAVDRQAAGHGMGWTSAEGNEGVVQELPKKKKAEEPLPVGEIGAPPSVEPEAVGTEQPLDNAMSHIEVDSVVARDPSSTAPTYPPSLLARRIEGSTFVHYVVDTTGRVDTLTIRVIRTTHPEFAQSVRTALAGMKFRPAIQASHKVRQWVEQNFSFKIVAPSLHPPSTSDLERRS